MTDEGWLQGLGELVSCLPAQDDTPERKAIRGETYRRELDGLTDELWLAAVKLAIQRREWFPPVAVLLEYAAEAATALPRWAALPPDTRNIEQKRQDARVGFEFFRAELMRRGVMIPVEPVRVMREPRVEG